MARARRQQGDPRRARRPAGACADHRHVHRGGPVVAEKRRDALMGSSVRPGRGSRMKDSIDELKAELSANWDFETPASAAELAQAEKALGDALPAPLADFYRRAAGASVGQVDVFMVDEFIDINRHRERALRFAVFFGSD